MTFLKGINEIIFNVFCIYWHYYFCIYYFCDKTCFAYHKRANMYLHETLVSTRTHRIGSKRDRSEFRILLSFILCTVAVL